MIDNRPDYEEITYFKAEGLNNEFFYLPDSPPYTPVIDLTGYTATCTLYDECGGTSIGTLTSGAGTLAFFTDTAVFDSQDEDTGVITSYSIPNAQGVKFNVSPVAFAAFTWITAYFELVITSSGGTVEPFLRGTLSPGDCSC